MRILQLCAERNISLNELALSSLLTQSTINNITSGRNKSVKVSTIETICKGLGITLFDFFEPTRRPKFTPEATAELKEFENYLIKKYNLK
ncbi:helix-turn-helix domain-containing protein [Sporomusa sphaeroides]|uniref:Helix-turn-helix protein n=1 Tax=Sporomusa sphaeroides DSM 2875 TaxID=1337886 RepID=A0ABP2C1T4_9FIRM|nr:helix-turn-helix transcriptional regulator [Sporomusa sphaeroides]OLS56330.1 helix-turn-helix protein [Sporomusa sphaeroides DSM 2875]CVK18425.1 helix-turn-helix protein [Sporomusa sphaeroides DSM 2875]